MIAVPCGIPHDEGSALPPLPTCTSFAAVPNAAVERFLDGERRTRPFRPAKAWRAIVRSAARFVEHEGSNGWGRLYLRQPLISLKSCRKPKSFRKRRSFRERRGGGLLGEPASRGEPVGPCARECGSLLPRWTDALFLPSWAYSCSVGGIVTKTWCARRSCAPDIPGDAPSSFGNWGACRHPRPRWGVKSPP